MTTFFGSGTKTTQAAQAPAVSGLQVQSSTYGAVIPIVYGTMRMAPNLIWYGDFVATSHTQDSSSGGGKGGSSGGGGSSTTYTYSTALMFGLSEGPIQGVGTVYVEKVVSDAPTLGFSVFLGSYPQTSWGYLTSFHPDEALGYNGISMLASASYYLADSPNLSNHNVEVIGIFSNSVSGMQDSDPSLVVVDVLTNGHYGAGYPISRVGDFTTYQNYTLAAGLLISPCYDSQQNANQILQDIADNTNSAWIFSSGVVTLVPYGDATLTGNGKTYTPPSTPVYDLNDDDFIYDSGTDPVLCTRSTPADTINSIQIEYKDRTNSYNIAIAQAKDQSSIDTYGLRQNSATNAHLFALGDYANLSAQLQLQRMAIRNIFSFTLSQRHARLDAMDIVTITDVGLALNQQWVRVLTISEDDNYNLAITAEEYLNGSGNAPLYTYQGGNGYNVNYNLTPGNSNMPVIFEPPVQIATSYGLQTWIAASGGENWGGCDVWISSDGDTYKLAGRLQGNSRQGFLTASLPSHADPDTVNTLSVNLAESRAELLSGTQQDADLGNTLCYVDGELISYQTATLTGANAYNLTYLRRGMYGSVIAAHANATQFARLDTNGVFIYPYDKTQIGQAIYVKILGYNIFGGAQQSLADVSPYTHVIQGPPLPSQVQGFSGQQNGGAVVFKWIEIVDYALKGYDILYAPKGIPLAGATFLTESARGTEMTNASVPPGSWTFYIQARDIADQVSAVASSFDLVVANENSVIYSVPSAPDFVGTLSGFTQYYLGELVPNSRNLASSYDLLAAPSAPSVDQVSGGTLSAATYFVKITYVTDGGETLPSTESSIAVSANNLLSVSGPAASGAATGFNVYVGTTSGTETLQNAVVIPIGAGWTMPTTGLISGAALPSSNSTGWEVFNVFVPDVVASATFTGQTIDVQFDSQIRIWANIASIIGLGDTGIPNVTFQIDSWLSAGMDPNNFINWTIGLLTARYIRPRLKATFTDRQVPYITSFTPVIDSDITTQNYNSVAVASSGTTLTFSSAFHAPPSIQCTPTSAGATSASATAITNTSALITVYNGSTAVAGTANVTVEGV